MIKGLASVMGKLECVFTEAVHYHVHTELQEFIQITMREPLRKAVKNSKRTLMKTYVYNYVNEGGFLARIFFYSILRFNVLLKKKLWTSQKSCKYNHSFLNFLNFKEKDL